MAGGGGIAAMGDGKRIGNYYGKSMAKGFDLKMAKGFTQAVEGERSA